MSKVVALHNLEQIVITRLLHQRIPPEKSRKTYNCFSIRYRLPKFLCTINNEIIFKSSTTGLKLTIFIHIKTCKIKTILVSGLHFPLSVV